ncbi:hypothetical protein HMPREF1544_09687 [Mucor circinelloides 1006PhL]|uniref:Uncharacterized protein n=1 Tax=Mucor circinelloides f. circinelloides (strain 1006PhL) TaxID=1220926 RepID=S2JUV2_MUCC1|nr:hypothetical protein HMPREF1544_09687 [Mucor circinelloides 1006PhL]
MEIKGLRLRRFFNEEDHGDDTRSERSLITYPVHAERLGKITGQESPQLGHPVRRMVTAIRRRDSVAAIHHLEEWITNQEVTDEGSRNYNTYGQFGNRVGSVIPSDGGIWVLDRRRDRWSINVRQLLAIFSALKFLYRPRFANKTFCQGFELYLGLNLDVIGFISDLIILYNSQENRDKKRQLAIRLQVWNTSTMI